MIHKSLHHHIKKHIRKHKRKYLKFFLIFIALVLYGSLDNIVTMYFFQNETPLKIIGVAIMISAVFTAIGEVVEKIWEKYKK